VFLTLFIVAGLGDARNVALGGAFVLFFRLITSIGYLSGPKTLLRRVGASVLRGIRHTGFA
jgi:hypothetical protein